MLTGWLVNQEDFRGCVDDTFFVCSSNNGNESCQTNVRNFYSFFFSSYFSYNTKLFLFSVVCVCPQNSSMYILYARWALVWQQCVRLFKITQTIGNLQ